MRVTNITAAWMLCAAIALPARAQDANEVEEARPEAAAEQAAPAPSFEYRTGDVVLPNKVATLKLTEGHRYMSAADANKLLELWGNLPDSRLQGAVVPAGVDPLGDSAWVVFLTYSDDGHVDDSDAAEIDYEELLQSMKEGEEQANEQRKAAGYPALTLVGWAEQPHYDAGAKKLYWAKEIAAEGGGGHALNYDVRVLGREGVLSMEAVAPIDLLPKVREEMKPLLAIAEFNEGYRYAEFNAKTDRMAEYGLGALIAGGVAAKLGLFAKLGVFLLAFKKFIFIGLIALGGLVMKLLGRKKDAST
jgi:uncharacterized membrane-anchored protein